MVIDVRDGLFYTVRLLQRAELAVWQLASIRLLGVSRYIFCMPLDCSCDRSVELSVSKLFLDIERLLAPRTINLKVSNKPARTVVGV